MAVSLSIDVQVASDCKKLVVTNNHNHDGNTVDTVEADIYRDGTKIKDNLSVSTSDVQNNNDIEITTQDTAGTSSNETFQDGIYQVQLTVTYTNNNSYATNDRDISYCNAYNCIVAKVGKASLENCNCEDKKVEDTWDLYMMLQGALHLFSCGDYTSAGDELAKANALCDADCGC